MPVRLYDPERDPEVSYDDGFLVPYNPLEDRVREVASDRKIRELDQLKSEAERLEQECTDARGRGEEPSHELAQRALEAWGGFDRALRTYAKAKSLGKRLYRDDLYLDTDALKPIDGFGEKPAALTNMKNLVGKRMVEGGERMGCPVVIPQDKTDAELTGIAKYIQGCDPRYPTPVTVTQETTIRRFREYLEKRPMKTAVVVNGGGQFVGVVHEDDVREVDLDRAIEKYVRRSDVVTAKDGIAPEEALDLLDQSHVDLLPILRSDDTVAGAFTEKGASYGWLHKPFLDEETGKLALVGAIGALNDDPVKRARLLIRLGFRGIVLDTANFDQEKAAYENLEAIRKLVDRASKEHITIIAGNVVTREATRRVLSAGADIVKVGIGPGSLCTTRVQTAVGRPQLSAVMDCAEMAARFQKHIWADGGIKYPRDIALALAGGASQAMWGSMFTGVAESPPLYAQDDDGQYKLHSAMASRQASEGRGLKSATEQTLQRVRRILGHRAEGVQDVKVRRRWDSIADGLHGFFDGLSSTLSYHGAHNLREFPDFARIGIQTRSGYDEGKPVGEW
jgi:IMP dehydrogenase